MKRIRILRIVGATYGLVVLAYGLSNAHASPVYKWEENGIIHYASKPGAKEAKPADLPPIMRGEMKLADRKLVSCDRHGGVNCGAGADTDGSVICTDGFREGSARFRFTCSSPKLEITDVSELTQTGSFTVFVRNSRSVTATDPSLSFKTETGKEIKLKGPKQVDAFGIAEFQYQSDQSIPLSEKPTMAQLNVTCSNCPE